MTRVFMTGATGYVGRALAQALTDRGHQVTALVRKGSEHKCPAAVHTVFGSALESKTYVDAIPEEGTFVNLVGVPHPSPWKREQFWSVDYVSGLEAVRAASRRRVAHFVYLSVAQPTPIMKTYVKVRSEVEKLIRDAGVPATVVRPWYILGPSHRWPMMLLPFYWLLERNPLTMSSAKRLGLVTLQEMVAALVYAIEHPPSIPGAKTDESRMRIWDVPRIRDVSS